MRTLIVLIAGAAIGLATWIVVGSPFAKRPVSKAGIERAVTKRTSGQVQLTLCNEEVVPSQTPHPASQHTWTCDTYLGPSPADAQNGPSYKVIVDDGSIRSIRRVPTH